MKLTDLEPRWTQVVMMNHHGSGQSNFPPAGFVNGVSFICPHCIAIGAIALKQRLAVAFTPAFGPQDWLTPGQPITPPEQKVWTRTGGETFETLNLSPSLDFSADPNGRIDFAGHWHGHIKDGEVT